MIKDASKLNEIKEKGQVKNPIKLRQIIANTLNRVYRKKWMVLFSLCWPPIPACILTAWPGINCFLSVCFNHS